MSIVTCHTGGCTSQGVPVPMELSYIDPISGTEITVTTVICGACGQQITDISDPQEA
jgi:hypothetical protein